LAGFTFAFKFTRMFKKTAILFLISVLTLTAFAQDKDSLTFVKTHWTKSKVAS